MLSSDQRAHLAVGVGAGADTEPAHACADGLYQRVGDVTHRDDDGDCHAAFAGGAVAGGDGGVRGEVHVGVRQDEHVVLCAAQRLHAFPGGGAALVDGAGDGRRADEGDCADIGVVEETLDRDLVAVSCRSPIAVTAREAASRVGIVPAS